MEFSSLPSYIHTRVGNIRNPTLHQTQSISPLRSPGVVPPGDIASMIYHTTCGLPRQIISERGKMAFIHDCSLIWDRVHVGSSEDLFVLCLWWVETFEMVVLVCSDRWLNDSGRVAWSGGRNGIPHCTKRAWSPHLCDLGMKEKLEKIRKSIHQCHFLSSTNTRLR